MLHCSHYTALASSAPLVLDSSRHSGTASSVHHVDGSVLTHLYCLVCVSVCVSSPSLCFYPKEADLSEWRFFFLSNGKTKGQTLPTTARLIYSVSFSLSPPLNFHFSPNSPYIASSLLPMHPLTNLVNSISLSDCCCLFFCHSSSLIPHLSPCNAFPSPLLEIREIWR